MADEETTGGETPPQQPPAGTGAGAPPETGKDGTAFDAERAQRTIQQLRDEVKAGKTAAKDLEAAQTKIREYEQAQLSETERLNAQLKDAQDKATALESKYQATLIRTAIEREAMAGDAVDADAVVALVDRSAITIEDGTVTGADKAVSALLKAKPYLVKSENGTRSVPATGKPGGSKQPSAEDTEKVRQKVIASGAYPRF